MDKTATMVIHFTDGTKAAFRYPKLQDASVLASKIRQALEQDKIVVETCDSLFVVPASSVKYIQVTPAPSALPEGVFRDAEIVG